jgi:4-hydroxybenzoate polyprenyltransferase
MTQYTEDDLNHAIEDVANGKPKKLAAREWGVPESTLRNRIKGSENHSIAAESQQRLSKVQEDHLANWVLTQEALGVPLTHAQIKEFAQRLLTIKGDYKSLGKRWMQAFLRRNPILKTKRFRNIDSQRVNGATTSIIKSWFRLLAIPQIQAIKPEHRYNMDESGIMEGFGANGLVVGNAEKRSIQKKQPGSRAWTSFLECISATGKALTPLVIFKGKTVQQQWFPQDLTPYDGWQFTSTENGWTTDATAIEWLQKVFLPQTDTTEPRLLILDGHGSHETTDFMYLCYQHNVHLLFLPPHSSHVLQPLDLSVFSSLKSRYRKEVGYLTLLTDSSPLGKQNFLACYQKARKEALSAKNIKSGWKATGLWPKSIAKPLMSPLLLENSNMAKKTLSQPSQSLIEKSHIDWNSNALPVIWSTPKKSTELKAQAAEFQKLQNQDHLTQRLLFRKIVKGFEEQESVLANHELKIQSLEVQLEKARPKKRKKVKISPNSKFADIQAIQRTQNEVNRVEIEEEALDIDSLSDPTLDCIEVE